MTQITVGRIFGPQAYGLYAIGWTILRIAGLVSIAGWDTAIIRYGASYQSVNTGSFKRVLTAGVGLPLLFGAVLAGALNLVAAPLADRVFGEPQAEPIIRWFSLGIVLWVGMKAAAAATRVSKRMQYAVVAEEIGQPLVGLVLIALSAVLGLGILGASAASVLSLAAGVAIAFFFVRRLYPGVFGSGGRSIPPWRELIAFSLTVSGSRIFTGLITWMDRLMLGSFRTATEVGVFQAAAQASGLFLIILSGFNNIFSPIAADLWHQNQRDRLQVIFRTSTKWGLYLSLPIFVVILAVPGEILSAVFGSAYAAGGLALVVLAAGQLINLSTGASGQLLSLSGHHSIWAKITGTMFGLALLLNLILVPRYGMVGAASATSVSIGSLFVIGLLQVRSKLSMWPYDRRYLKGLAAAVGAGLAAAVLKGTQIAGSLPGLAALTLLVVAVFGAILLALGLDAEDREFIGLIRQRLRGTARSRTGDA